MAHNHPTTYLNAASARTSAAADPLRTLPRLVSRGVGAHKLQRNADSAEAASLGARRREATRTGTKSAACTAQPIRLVSRGNGTVASTDDTLAHHNQSSASTPKAAIGVLERGQNLRDHRRAEQRQASATPRSHRLALR